MWSAIPKNETGGDILQYKIIYYETTEGEFSHSTVKLLIDDLKLIDEEYYIHEICGLKPESDYTVAVSGINRNGEGPKESFEMKPSSVGKLFNQIQSSLS